MAGKGIACKGLLFILLLCSPIYVVAQAAAEEQLENRFARTEETPEDDSQEQQQELAIRHKVQLNNADAAALSALGLLSSLQINRFLLYRQQLGKLLSIYELQAIPGFDEETIRRLLPYVQVGNDLEPHYDLKDRVRKGTHSLLVRYGRQLETSRGYMSTDSTTAPYRGSPDRYMLRYRYQLPKYTSWGIIAEKDAGERGVDFYSAHLSIQNYKCIKAVVVGDFTVNMGQGLLNWQSLAFGKGPAVMQVKREGALLKPYASSGEFLFYRGAAITLQQGHWQGTAFISRRQLDGNITNSSGYHRSDAEMEKRHSLTQFTTGGNITYERPLWHIAFNMIRQQFSAVVGSSSAPYNMFAFRGQQLVAMSMDYAFTWKQLHFFGESAVSDNHQPGLLHGVLAGVCRNVDLVLLYRYYSRGYQSIYGDAWGEYYKPANESGLYTGLSIKPGRYLKLEAYSDVFRFPWLQYRLPSPGGGREMLVALTYTPDKQTVFFASYIHSYKQQQVSGEQYFIRPGAAVKKQRWRCELKMQLTRTIALKSRVEVNNYLHEEIAQHGYLLFQEISYGLPRIQLYTRYTRFVTGGTESSVYTITKGVLYENALSRLYGAGHQLQVYLRWKTGHKCTAWIRYQQTLQEGVSTTGSGWDMIHGNRENMIICQLHYLFK